MEIWKDIQGFEGRYQVSSEGNVKSLRFRGHDVESLMKISEHHTGYLIVQLGKHPSKTYLVHQLVARAFLPTIKGKEIVNHIDGNKKNNNVNNLEWTTYKENTEHAIRTGLRDPHKVIKKIGKDHYSSKPVLQYSLNGEFIKKWDSQSDVARAYNIKSINFCIDSLSKSCCGYMWRTYRGNIPQRIEPCKSRLRPIQITQSDLQGNFIKTWDSINAAAKALSISRKGISDCCYGRQKSSGGFMWSF